MSPIPPFPKKRRFIRYRETEKQRRKFPIEEPPARPPDIPIPGTPDVPLDFPPEEAPQKPPSPNEVPIIPPNRTPDLPKKAPPRKKLDASGPEPAPPDLTTSPDIA